MFTDFVKLLYGGYAISTEVINSFSYSPSWMNMVTMYGLNAKGKKVRIDIRLAYHDVTCENLVDFIDYNCLLNRQCNPVDEYQIIYLGLFGKEVGNHQVPDYFLIDKFCKTVEHRYVNLDSNGTLKEYLHVNFPEEFARLKAVEINDFSIKDSVEEKEFGLRTRGVVKQNLDGSPLISVIMPCFNSVATIEQSLQSAIVQGYNNMEIIIVDGGSKDRTAAVVKKYENRIDLFKSEPDKNIFDAINKGTHQSKGRYSIFIGSDDLLVFNALQVVVDAIKKNGELDYFYGDFLTLQPNGTIIYNNCYIKRPTYESFLMAHPALYINRRVFDEFDGFDINYHICADADFELKLITKQKSGVKIEQSLCIFRGGGHSSFKFKNIQQVKEIFRKYDGLNIRYYRFFMKMYTINTLITIFGQRVLPFLSQIKKVLKTSKL